MTDIVTDDDVTLIDIEQHFRMSVGLADTGIGDIESDIEEIEDFLDKYENPDHAKEAAEDANSKVEELIDELIRKLESAKTRMAEIAEAKGA